MPSLPGRLPLAFLANGIQELVQLLVLALTGHTEGAGDQGQTAETTGQTQACTFSGT